MISYFLRSIEKYSHSGSLNYIGHRRPVFDWPVDKVYLHEIWHTCSTSSTYGYKKNVGDMLIFAQGQGSIPKKKKN